VAWQEYPVQDIRVTEMHVRNLIADKQTTKENETLEADTQIGDEAADNLDIKATLNSQFKLGGNDLTNGGKGQYSTVEIINDGTGDNPVLGANASAKRAKLEDELEVNNVGTGSNPILSSDFAAQTLQLTGNWRMDGNFRAAAVEAVDSFRSGGGNDTPIQAVDSDTDSHVTVATLNRAVTPTLDLDQARQAPSGTLDFANTTSQTASGTNGSYTTSSERYIFVDTATNSTAFTVTLASADAEKGRTIEVKDSGGGAGSNNITINTEGTETIDGQSNVTISSNFGAKTLVWNGNGWSIV
jgi:hypothetical protein